jgi:FMN-dependent NADH-azoreductase
MPTLLHIDSSPRGRSRSRQLTRLFAELWTGKFPDTEIIHRDLAVFAPPHVGEPWIAAAFTPPDQRTRPMSQALQISDLLVDELLRADAVVIGTPMYNFGLPSVLKAYFDNVIRVNRTFLFEPDDSENPYKPLVEDKPAYVVVATGDAGYRRDARSGTSIIWSRTCARC